MKILEVGKTYKSRICNGVDKIMIVKRTPKTVVYVGDWYGSGEHRAMIRFESNGSEYIETKSHGIFCAVDEVTEAATETTQETEPAKEPETTETPATTEEQMTEEQMIEAVGKRAEELAKDPTVKAKAKELYEKFDMETAKKFVYQLAIATLCGAENYATLCGGEMKAPEQAAANEQEASALGADEAREWMALIRETGRGLNRAKDERDLMWIDMVHKIDREAEEAKRNGVTLKVEYDADGRFVEVRERKPETGAFAPKEPEQAAPVEAPVKAARPAIYQKIDALTERAAATRAAYYDFSRAGKQDEAQEAFNEWWKLTEQIDALEAKAATPASQAGPETAAGQPAPQEAATSEGDMGEIMTAEKSRKAKPPKQYTIRVTRDRTGRAHDHTGTLEELIQAFSYTLEKGKSWEWERGRHKINLAPKTARSLVNNLQNASDNATVNGYSGVCYELVTV